MSKESVEIEIFLEKFNDFRDEYCKQSEKIRGYDEVAIVKLYEVFLKRK